MERRAFVKSGALALVTMGLSPSFLRRTAFGMDLVNAPKGKVLICLFQRGAADALNIVVPHGERAYYAMRPSIAIPQPSGSNPAGAIDLDGFFGLHPALAPLKPLYDRKLLAPVHAVGSPSTTRSHFDAQDYMESATPGNKGTQDGWLNRYLQAKREPKATAFRAVSLTANLPRTLLGPSPAIAMTNIGDFGVRAGQGNGQVAKGFEELYAQNMSDVLHGTGKEAFEAVKMLKKANPQQYQPASGASYPRSPFGQALLQIAQLIKSDIGVEVAFTDVGGWDTHANQGNARGQLANRLQDFAQGIAALHQDLGDRMRNVVILTMTEFGRAVQENGNRGTDHGHASVAFALGGPVKGGRVYGEWPGLATEQLYEGRDLRLTTDFRDVFAEIAARHMGATNLGAIFPGYTPNPANFKGLIRG